MNPRTASAVIRPSMRHRATRYVMVLAYVLGGSRARAAEVICSTPMSISTPTSYDNVTVQSGCVLTVDSTLNAAGTPHVQHRLGSSRGSPSGAAGKGGGRNAVGAAHIARTL